MVSLSALPHIIIMLAAFITGIIANGFLISINAYELTRSRKLTTMGLLFIGIGMSRVGLQLVLMVQSFFSIFSPFFYREKIYGAAMIFFWMFFSSLSLWFATCLSVFYCLKISGFTQSCFSWLKFRISKFVSGLILGSLVVSTSTAVLCIIVDYPKNLDDEFIRNATLSGVSLNLKQVNEVFLVNLGLIFPLAIFVMCTFLLLISLCKHTRRMQSKAHGFRNASTKTHVNALRIIITFFCFFISYFVVFMVNMTFSLSYGSLCFFIVKDIMAVYPSGHSILIILSNSKFQQLFRSLLCLKWNR